MAIQLQPKLKPVAYSILTLICTTSSLLSYAGSLPPATSAFNDGVSNVTQKQSGTKAKKTTQVTTPIKIEQSPDAPQIANSDTEDNSDCLWVKEGTLAHDVLTVASSETTAALLNAGAAYYAYKGDEKTSRILAGVGAVSNGLGALDAGRSNTDRALAATSAVAGVYSAASKGKDSRNAAYAAAGLTALNYTMTMVNGDTGQMPSAPDINEMTEEVAVQNTQTPATSTETGNKQVATQATKTTSTKTTASTANKKANVATKTTVKANTGTVVTATPKATTKTAVATASNTSASAKTVSLSSTNTTNKANQASLSQTSSSSNSIGSRNSFKEAIRQELGNEQIGAAKAQNELDSINKQLGSVSKTDPKYANLVKAKQDKELELKDRQANIASLLKEVDKKGL